MATRRSPAERAEYRQARREQLTSHGPGPQVRRDLRTARFLVRPRVAGVIAGALIVIAGVLLLAGQVTLLALLSHRSLHVTGLVTGCQTHSAPQNGCDVTYAAAGTRHTVRVGTFATSPGQQVRVALARVGAAQGERIDGWHLWGLGVLGVACLLVGSALLRVAGLRRRTDRERVE